MMRTNNDSGFIYKPVLESLEKKYPTIVVDNFFKNPNIVRNFALSLPYEKTTDGRWPGQRSEMLHRINQNLYFMMIQKIMSVYYDLKNSEITWDDIQIMFQKIKKFSDVKDTVENKGWIHMDQNQTFAGVVFLTPNINPDCGTSIFKLKDEYKNFDLGKYTPSAKFKYYGEKNIEIDDYRKELDELNKKFEPITIVKNIYNRLVIFDSNEYHAADSYFSDGLERLTLVFFFKNVKEKRKPLDRIQEYDENLINEILKNTNENFKSKTITPEETDISDK